MNLTADNYVIEITKKGRKIYTGWLKSDQRFRKPVTVNISDVRGEFKEGDFLLLSKDEYYMENLHKGCDNYYNRWRLFPISQKPKPRLTSVQLGGEFHDV